MARARAAAPFLALARRAFASGPAEPPPEYARFYRGRVPTRRAADGGGGGAAPAAEPAAAAAPAQAAMSDAQVAAATATTWMFPWERRQLDGGGLRPWEKVYWGLFVTALAALGYTRLIKADPAPPPPSPSADAREAARRAAVRPLLAGAPLFVLEGEADPFDGETPAEIEAYVSKHAGVTAGAADRFEGLEPAEIEALLAEHGGGGGE